MKENLLSKWLESKEKAKEKAKHNATDEATNKYPLAYNQQALYFLCQLHPENPFYNLAEIYRFQQGLNVEAFIEAFRFQVKQHEVLRTRFVLENGYPVQIVEKEAELSVRVHDYASKSVTEEEVIKLIKEDARLPFDLSNPCLLRLCIVKSEKDQYVVGVIVHHIIMDMWSMGILITEVADHYKRIINGQLLQIKELSTSYGRYAKKQTDQQIDPATLNYWIEKLQLADDVLNLPSDHQRPPFQTFDGGVIRTSVPKETCDGIRALCRRFNVTPFVILLSSYYILLYKYSRNRSIKIGVPFSNKHSSDLEHIIGFFDETLILCTDIQDFSYAEFMATVKNTVYDAFEHKEIPIEEIIKALKPERHIGINPLFQVMFIYGKMPSLPSFGDHISYSVERLDFGISKFDLSLFVGEDESGFHTSFEYASDLYRPSTIQSYADHYIRILSQIIDNPEISLSHIGLLSEAETHQVIHKWNDTAFALEMRYNIPDLVGAQAERFADKIALADNSSRITYKSLHEKSEQIAANLNRAGVKSGDFVGLYFDRSVHMVICMLGVMKSGAAYLPLDPEYPANRIKYMIHDSAVAAIISESVLAEDLRRKFDCPVHAYDRILESTDSLGQKRVVRLEDAAYMIYTSGSTGDPKGVVVTHLNLLNSTVVRHQYYDEPPEHFLLFPSFSFDSSVAGIFWTLSTGGTLVISQKRLEQDMEKLGEVFADEKITHTLLLPGLYREILMSVSSKKLNHLKCVIVAGEACDPKLPQYHFERLQHTRFYNEYGPTEATVWSTVEEIKADTTGAISIGKPIGNTQVFILDQDMQPVPRGVSGEIHIGGLNIARGYWNNDIATSEKFIENPFNTEGNRLYRTGDLGKYDHGGKIVFLGRADGQVKIRGYRVELKEIEKHVKNLPGVKECLVRVINSNGHGDRIVCYFTEQGSIDLSEMRSSLQSELPAYMIPSDFIHLNEMPRLPNGKLDTEKLESHEVLSSNLEIEPPGNEVERRLYEIWKGVLKRDAFGIHDNFFAIGGDSIVSIRIISKARNSGLKIDPSQIFEHQTIHELAKNVKFEGPEHSISRESYVGESVLTPYQLRSLNAIGDSKDCYLPGYKISLRSTISEEHSTEFMEKILEMHDVLRQTFSSHRASGKLKYKPFNADAFIERVSHKDLKEIQASCDLENGPLFKMILVRDSAQAEKYDHVIFLAHPLVFDNFSWKVLIDQFISYMKSRAKGESKMPGRVHTGFKEWATAIASSEMLPHFQSQIDYWRDEVKAEDRYNDVAISSSMEVVEKQLEVSGASLLTLKNDALDAYGLKIHELLQVAYAITIGNFADQDRIVFWTQTDGRAYRKNGMDCSKTAGCFTSCFPLSIEPELDLKSTVIKIKEKYRSVPSAGIGYDHLKYNSKHDDLKVKEKFFFSFSELEIPMDKELIDTIESVSPVRFSSNWETDHCISLHCDIDVKGIHLHFISDINTINNDEMEKFVMDYKRNLDLIIDHCSKAGRQYTPGDFPDADLSEDDLNTLFGQI